VCARDQRPYRQVRWEVIDVVRAVEAVEGVWPIGALNRLVRFPDGAALRAFGGGATNDLYRQQSIVSQFK
jgi:hypothetical protein